MHSGSLGSIVDLSHNHLTIVSPFHWICFALGSQLKTITRFYVRLTIDSQSPHNCFSIVSRFSRVAGGFVLGTDLQPKNDSTSDSQSTHNRLTIVWSMFCLHVECLDILWNSFQQFISFCMRISVFHRFSVILNDSTTMFIDVCKTHWKSVVFLMFRARNHCFPNGKCMCSMSFSLKLTTVQRFASIFSDFERRHNNVHLFLQKTH